MFRSILAITVAATCAAVFVGFVPQPAPAVAAVEIPEPGAAGAAKRETGVSGINIGAAACVQAWPYYEPSCLRDARRPGSSVRVVRVITAGKPAADRIRQVQR